MMTSLEGLEHQLMTDELYRRRFAAAPGDVIRERRVDLPTGRTVPPSLPLPALELKMLELSVRLQQAGILVGDGAAERPDYWQRLGELAGRLAADSGADDATAWLLQTNELVVAREHENPPPPITAPAAIAGGPDTNNITVVGPTGTKLTCQSVEEVAALIKRLRQ